MFLTSQVLLPLNVKNLAGREYDRASFATSLSEKSLLGVVGPVNDFSIDLRRVTYSVSNIRIEGESVVGDINTLTKADVPDKKILEDAQKAIDSGNFVFRLAGFGKLDGGVVREYVPTFVTLVPKEEDTFSNALRD